ncbi:hypothetical protein [Asaia bogorensis]|uniref:Uncharacterized protein n=1 Tax=Asaia bogorensis NBRC 16594 TaxID=1231624 RepID=A0AAN4U3D0_9PROT|nr:hypothetical protein [Asaia bogorensis]BAT19787.1 hypothetical protein Asbog_01514 [Asaia bogorensis NBRC 16594]GBQ77706.1 hypothetical protein AA0311_1522 [Asaia bogorensis NBRC 16594]GEL54373.1 hypothetical protein ABO01nite_23800 [Asaia bogorensis NBRC 16594]
MSGKWTPGPWSLDRDEEEGGIAILDASGAQLGILHGEGEQVSDDAHLIATSPELAEALEELYADARELLVSATSCAGRQDLNADDLEERGFAPDSFAKARAVLAKAKGEGA